MLVYRSVFRLILFWEPTFSHKAMNHRWIIFSWGELHRYAPFEGCRICRKRVIFWRLLKAQEFQQILKKVVDFL